MALVQSNLPHKHTTMDIILENLRCFAGRHEAPIKPITILTGENSAGKSTFMAAVAAVQDVYGFPIRPGLNSPPYSLGYFDTIATYEANTFSLGFRPKRETHSELTEAIATYSGNKGLVEISRFECNSADLDAILKFSGTGSKRTVEYDIKRGQKSLKGRSVVPGMRSGRHFIPINELLYLTLFHGSNGAKDAQEFERVGMALFRMFSSSPASGDTLSLAPIRTRPRRTYDDLSDEFSPEGEHIPFALSRVLADPELSTLLIRFGEASGLYQSLDVLMLGSNDGAPRQVIVTNSNRGDNLIDVGYGVSQVLPVIVQAIIAESATHMMLQQPEVHLHPRAQAALGSFIVALARERRMEFVIETHSDYIIDRIRMEIARKRFQPEDVAILYFEKVGSSARIHSLQLDKNGNIMDAPPTYRDFFLREELDLMYRTEI
jgi:hypothetical protein